MVGPALTLQWMPKREDMTANHEYADTELQWHRHAMYHTQPGDIMVVDACGDMSAGVFGEMMFTYFKGRGGIGRGDRRPCADWPDVEPLALGLWMRGVTPNHGWQNSIMPFAVNVPIACAGVLVMPGDLIIADNDGAIVVPVKSAPELIKKASEKNEWEEFTRLKFAEGGDLRKYYPLNAEAQAEYTAWLAQQKPPQPSPTATTRPRQTRQIKRSEQRYADFFRSVSKNVCDQALVALETPPDLADLMADSLVGSSLTGHDSHGVTLLPGYAGQVRAGSLKPAAWPTVEPATGMLATLSVDGAFGWGPVAERSQPIR